MFDKPHYISGNKSVSIPKRTVLFDIETNQDTLDNGDIKQTFRLGCGVFHRITDIKHPHKAEWMHTLNSRQLCEWILSKARSKERLYIISANVWFDIRTSNMLFYLREQGWVNSRLFVNGMVLIIVFTLNNKTIVFLNFQNYFRSSVAAMGKSFGLPKLKVVFDDCSDKKLMEYCHRDVKIISRAMLTLYEFIKGRKLGNFGFTFPSIAFNIYRHRFMHHKLLVHKKDDIVALERKAYFGGRVDCHRIGTFKGKHLIQLDVNAMYAHVMKKFKYPCLLKYRADNVKLDVFNEFISQYLCCAHVQLKTEQPVYPVRLKNKTAFPVGYFDTYLTTPSLKYALDHNHLKRVYKASFYTGEHIFTDYVDYFFNLKRQYTTERNTPFILCCKLLMNSLYGKFGQRGDEILSEWACDYNDISRVKSYDLDRQAHLITTMFYGRATTVARQTLEARNSIVSIVAHVADYARMLLWSYMEQIGLSNLYYNDTDCIIFDCSNVDLKLLPINNIKLGYFKVEHVGTDIVLRGLKDYEFCGNTKIKGVSKRAIQIDTNVYEQLYFPGIFSDLKTGLKEPYMVKKVVKHLKRKYTKGTVSKQGIVKPLIFNQEPLPPDPVAPDSKAQ